MSSLAAKPCFVCIVLIVLVMITLLAVVRFGIVLSGVVRIVVWSVGLYSTFALGWCISLALDRTFLITLLFLWYFWVVAGVTAA